MNKAFSSFSALEEKLPFSTNMVVGQSYVLSGRFVEKASSEIIVILLVNGEMCQEARIKGRIKGLVRGGGGSPPTPYLPKS